MKDRLVHDFPEEGRTFRVGLVDLIFLLRRFPQRTVRQLHASPCKCRRLESLQLCRSDRYVIDEFRGRLGRPLDCSCALVESRCDDGDHDILRHILVDNGSEDDVGFLSGCFVDDLCCFVHLDEAQGLAAGNVDEYALRAGNGYAFQERTGDRFVSRIRCTVFAVRNIHARMDALAAQLSQAQRRNFERWPILGKRIWPNYYVGRTYDDEVNWMKNWISRRLAWIDRQFVAAPTVVVNPTTLACTPGAGEGKIYFTLDGTDPRQPGGSVSPKARALDGPVKLPPRAKLFARTLVENRWSPPTRRKL